MNTKRVVTVLMLLASLVMGEMHMAYAQGNGPSQSSPQPVIVTGEVESPTFEVPMVVSGSQRTKGPTTDDVRYGSCGSTFIYVEDGGSLLARVRFGASSTMGTIVSISWGWTLRKNGPSGTVVGNAGDFTYVFATSWGTANYRDISPWGAGTYWAQLDYLNATLADGTTCYGLVPSGAGYVD